MSLFDLSGRVTIVTGATKGLGRASVDALAEFGGTVVITSRQAEDAQAVAAEINSQYGAGRALGVAYELQDRASGAVLIDRVMQEYGRIDTLICNAAHVVYGRLEEMDEDLEALDLAFQSNVRNYAALTRRVVPIMRAQGGGGVVYVLSTLGFFGSPPFLPYAIAKAALAHLTKILAVDYGPDNIRVNSIVPGSFYTASKLQTNPDAAKNFIGKIPLSRQGQPNEIAGLSVLLASPAGAYATGQNFIIDGGQLQKGMEGAQEGYDKVMGRNA